MESEKVLFTWSGGKDSAMALYELQRRNGLQVSALLTTVTEGYDRISMHGVRDVLLQQQAESLGICLERIHISKLASNEEYESKMRHVLQNYQRLGVSCVVFGDIFLEELRRYREENLKKIGMDAHFPLWKRDTKELAYSFINLGFKAIVTCIDTKSLEKSFAGRIFDEQFIRDLPDRVDPCGENGEFHSFVFDGPIFARKINFETGEIVLRDNQFYFCDLIPVPDEVL